ncbi:MAG TPA: hypothetical protein VGO62_20275 [Myxococcota bacterium]|jgi:lysozyme family protein
MPALDIRPPLARVAPDIDLPSMPTTPTVVRTVPIHVVEPVEPEHDAPATARADDFGGGAHTPTVPPVAVDPAQRTSTIALRTAPVVHASPAADHPNLSATMQAVLADDTTRANNAKADPRYAAQVRQVIGSLDQHHRSLIDQIAKAANLPAALVCGIWYREASLKDGVYLHNGDPLGKPTTHVPKGIDFGIGQFVEAAVSALNDKAHLRDALGLTSSSTDLGAMCAYAEAYNGLGYHNKGRASPYALAGTDQYKGGMFVADGVYDPNKFDGRPGVFAIAEAFLQ